MKKQPRFLCLYLFLFTGILLAKPGYSTTAVTGPYDVDITQTVLTDSTRDREVPVHLFIPSGPQAGQNQWPVAVISHGGGESGTSMQYLARHLASHGFLTAAPTHRGSDRALVDSVRFNRAYRLFADIESTFGPRPADIKYILDWLMAESDWHDRLDTAKITVLGHCLGATTAMAVAGLTADIPGAPGQTFRDPRIRAVVALGPQIGSSRGPGLTDSSWSTVETPALVVVGGEDFYWSDAVKNDPARLRMPYDTLPTMRCLMTIKGAQHHAFTDSDPYYPAGQRDPRHHDWINAAVSAFLKAVLNDDGQAKAWWVGHELAAAYPQDIAQEHQDMHLQVESVLMMIRDNDRDVEFSARATLPSAPASYPVLLFSPHIRGTRDEYQPLALEWAANGMVVIIPDHEGTPNRGELSDEETLATWPSRSRDLIAVLDALPSTGLVNRIDQARIGAGGHLMGAHTAALIAGGVKKTPGGPVTFADPRIDALLMMSPQGLGQGWTTDSWTPIDVPMIVTTGTFDHSVRTGNTAEWRTDPYRYSDGPQSWLAWVEGLHSDYDGLVGIGIPADPGPIARDVLALTTAFWRSHLFPDPAADRRLDPSAWAANPRIDISYKEKEIQASLDSTAMAAAAAYSDDHNGAAVLIQYNGVIIFEHYAAGVDGETPIHIHSGTKGFWGPVAAAMVQDSLISSFDERAVETLPEWQTHPLKRQITLRNLLQLNPGLAQDVEKLQGHDRPTLAPDLYAHAVGVPLIDRPGEQFSYGPVSYYVLGEIFKRKLAAQARAKGRIAETPLDYLKRRILEPVGVETGEWTHDKSGNPHIPNGAWISARHWAAFGHFLLQKGLAGGTAPIIVGRQQPYRRTGCQRTLLCQLKVRRADFNEKNAAAEMKNPRVFTTARKNQ